MILWNAYMLLTNWSLLTYPPFLPVTRKDTEKRLARFLSTGQCRCSVLVLPMLFQLAGFLTLPVARTRAAL